MNIILDPQLSQKAARAVQGMPWRLRDKFVKALEDAKSVDELTDEYKDFLANGYKPDKVLPTLEEALKQVKIEWED